MALSAMTGTYASAIPWPLVSAFSIMLTLPPAIVYLLSQRFITSGLAVGSVKG
jgi:arabinogalactan oligomer/maltooligosaccharide transport system permease protein